jgi:uncharacterized protein with HEPN domain
MDKDIAVWLHDMLAAIDEIVSFLNPATILPSSETSRLGGR